MTETGTNGELALLRAEVSRLDQLRSSDREAADKLAEERTKRLDQRMDAADKAVFAALAAAEKAVAAALAASEKGVDKAETAQRIVNATQNEFRGSLKDQAATQMPRAEAENIFRELRGLISAQSATMAELRSRIDVGPPSLSTLQARSDEGIGRRGGTADMKSTIALAIAASIGAVSIAINFIK